MTSKSEAIVARELRSVLAPLTTGEPIEQSERLVKLECALEYFLPEELGWRYESSDAFRFVVARKVAPDEAEFVGLALLISDQTWTPIHLGLRLSADSDRVASLDCRVGEPGDGAGGLVRIPYGSGLADKVLHRLPDRVGAIDWVHRATRS